MKHHRLILSNGRILHVNEWHSTLTSQPVAKLHRLQDRVSLLWELLYNDFYDYDIKDIDVDYIPEGVDETMLIMAKEYEELNYYLSTFRPNPETMLLEMIANIPTIKEKTNED